MISLLALWAILGIIFTFIGMPILHACNVQTCMQKAEDRIFLAIWLGMITLADLLLFASLFTALTLYVAAFFVAIMLIPYFFKRYEFWVARPSADFVTGGILIVVTLLVAALSAFMTLGTPEDSGSYHIPMIAWLAEYGSVQGLALINHPFGYTNAWFALEALLKPEGFQFSLLSGLNSFIFYIMIAQTIAKLHRVWNRRADVDDWFFIIACALFCRYFFATLIFSPSADLPSALLVILTAWLIIVLSINNDATTDSMAKRPGSTVLILASGAVSIKFGTIPLLGIAAAYYVFSKGFNFRKVWVASAVIAPFAIIHVLVSTITSGCPLYPTPYFCTSLPWSLGSEQARQISETMFEFLKWVGPAPADANGLNWLWHKPPNQNLFNDKPLMFGLLIANILCGPFLYLKRKRINKDAALYTALIALSGIAFTITVIPHLRFSFGYFLVIPSLVCALFLTTLTQNSVKRIAYLNEFMALSIFVAVGFSFFQMMTGYLPDPPSLKAIMRVVDRVVLLPFPPSHVKHLDRVEGSNFEYFYPSGPNARGLCWDAPVPCAGRYLDHIWLQDENAGFKKGFVIKLPAY